MSFVHLGQYIATVTVGEWYLTPEEYQNRVEGYAQTWDALSLENLQKLTAEQWVDMGAQTAANIFYGAGGISRTIRYLKHIDALAKAERQAAQIAQKMTQVLDEVIGKNPLVVTAEGLVMRMSNGVDKVKGATGEIIKNSRALLESSYAKLMTQLETEIVGLRAVFDGTRKGFGSFANKNIKINYKHILGMDIKFYPDNLKFSGFHHDLMGSIEKSGVVQFTNKVMHKTGVYSAEIIVNGVKYEKTFFPAMWSRKQVIDAVLEAYDNFKASGLSGIKKPEGKWIVQGMTKEGIKIEMYITENMLINSAYPILK